MNRPLTIFVCLAFVLTGCMTTAAQPNKSQVQIRQAQTREYDRLNYQDTLRAVVATLLDLGFVIDEANFDLGTITGQRHWGATTVITVTVREKDSDLLVVRASVRGTQMIQPFTRPREFDHPQTYQDFFTALDKSMFLAQNQVN